MTGLAVIGTGGWGKNHVRTFRELMLEGAIDSLTVCDADSNLAGAVGREFEVEHTSDYRRLIEDRSVQAVSIATPSGTHHRLAKEFIEAGKDVLVEKPMTMDIDEATDLVGVAAGSDRILMVGHVFRYHPAVCELKRMMDSGELGDIKNLIGNRLVFRLPRSDMGVVYALGIHDLDLFCYLLGVDYPRSVIAAESRAYGQNTEETVSIVMDFGRTKGFAFESWLAPADRKIRDLVVVGSSGSARVDYLTPRELQVFDKRIAVDEDMPVGVEDGGSSVIAVADEQPLKEELRHFISCVSSRRNPLSDGSVGLRSVKMAEAALESAATGRAVALA